MIHAVGGERLDRLRNGLPGLGALDEPDFLSAQPLRRVACDGRAEEDRPTDAPPRRRCGAGHEIAVEVRAEDVRVALRGDTVGCVPRLGRERRSGHAARGAAAGGEKQDERKQVLHARLTSEYSSRFPIENARIVKVRSFR